MSEVALRDPLGMFDWTPRLFDWSPRLFDIDPEVATMRVEEYIENDNLIIKAEMPGIDPDKDISITVADGRLRVQARRSEESKHREKDSYRTEFHYGLFVRDIVLPLGVNRDDVTASYKDGVLTVHVPMPEVKEAISTIPIKHD